MTGMLRITRHSSNSIATLRLEGRLSGPSVRELERAADDSLVHCAGLRLDLAELDFVDASGADLIRELIARHVALLGCSSFVFELLRGIPQAPPKPPPANAPAGMSRRP